MPTATANGLTITYEEHGDPAAPPILLVMGLGGQLTLWPIEFVEGLAAQGFRVIRYDNRDIGLSTKFTDAGIPNIRRLLLRSFLGLRSAVPYTLTDMAADGMALLDTLGIERAHIVGVSMGGMIAQHMAFSYAHRVHSLTSVMSTTGNRWLPRPQGAALKALLDRPGPGASPEEQMGFTYRAARAIGSPGYPADEERLWTRIRSDYARSYHPTGAARQMAAIIADGDRRQRLKQISAPTLVIHGAADPLVPPSGGVDTATHISGARLEMIPGMGHDLPVALTDQMTGLIADHARQHP
jgi:pimeloyl-ACP methyl ester carboxylesterase